MTTEPREPPHQAWHYLLLVAVGFAVIGSTLLADRPLMVASFNNVAPAGPLPSRVALEPWQVDDWTVTIHRSDWNGPVARLLGHTRPGRPPRLGWVVREWSLMTLPLVAWRQSDLSMFREDGYGYRLSALTTEQRQAIDRAGGAAWFPWWRYVWGWLGVGAVAAFGWCHHRAAVRRREAMGLI